MFESSIYVLQVILLTAATNIMIDTIDKPSPMEPTMRNPIAHPGYTSLSLLSSCIVIFSKSGPPA
jgi:hypothetical protein